MREPGRERVEGRKGPTPSPEDISEHQLGSSQIFCDVIRKGQVEPGKILLETEIYVLLLGTLFKQNRKNPGSHRGGDYQ